MTTAALTHGNVLRVALPIMLSNITTPLIGLVDMAVLGQSPDPYLIGAVAVSAQIFSLIFWAFGFLRMGTTAFTAQADGRGEQSEVYAVLIRALVIAAIAGFLLFSLQLFIALVAFYLIPGSVEVERAARMYFDIRIWSAPATLANYAILGWFIGLGRADIALFLQLLLNGLNIFFDSWFVLGLGMGISGVAYGTLLAEYIAVFAGVSISFFLLKKQVFGDVLRRAFDLKVFSSMLSMNGDIMIRTLCLLVAFTFLTAQSAGMDDVTLAANAVLLALLTISAYFLDGFAYAAERFVGHSVGLGSRQRFWQAVFLSSQWAFLISVVVSVVFMVNGHEIIAAITRSEEVRAVAGAYLFWVVLAPVIGVACFQLDGVFIGATRTQDMRNMMLVSLAIYFVSWAILAPIYGNHGLWAAFMIFFVARAVTLAWRLPSLENAVFK